MPEIKALPLNGATTQQLQSIFTIWLIDGVTPELGAAGQQPILSQNSGAPTPTGIGTLVQITANRYYAQINTSALSLAVGDILVTEYLNAGIDQPSPGDTFQVTDPTTNNAQPSLPAAAYLSYVAVAEADVYFSMRLNRPLWVSTLPQQKLMALVEATQRIDRLNYGGKKADPAQLLQFPRGNTYTKPVPPSAPVNQLLFNSIDPFETIVSKDPYVPTDVKIATAELAYKLIDGVDPDVEIDRLATESQGFSSVKTIYNRKYIPEHVLAGIPSPLAWAHLRPYLRDPRTVRITRDS